MLPSDVIVVLAKVTFLFVCGFACLRLMTRSTAALRHAVCLSTIVGSLALLVTLFLPSPVVVLQLPAIAESVRTGGVKARGSSWVEFTVLLWACGFGVVLLRYVIGYALLAGVRRKATRLSALSADRISLADVNVPLVIGLVSPEILMPRSSGEWPEARRNAAIRHELAHIERNDLRTNCFCAVACAIYWFHPLSWLLVRRLRAEQEAACDDDVLRSGFERVDYAEALIETAGYATGYSLVSCPMTDRTSVKSRVVHILSPEKTAATRQISYIVFAGLALTMAAFSVAGAEQIYKVGGAVTAPRPIHQVQPGYTPSAMQAKIQGLVRVRLIIGPDGRTHNLEIVQGLDSGLDRNAFQALSQWRFRPSMRDGKPVAIRAKIDVNFHLQ